jgi:hypothetical protein
MAWYVFQNDTGLKDKNINADEVNANFDWIEGTIYPHSANTKSSNAYDIGSSAYLWRNMYAYCYLAKDGAVGTPSLTFADDTDSGFYRIGDNNIGLALAGAMVFDITSSIFTVRQNMLLNNGNYVYRQVGSLSVADINLHTLMAGSFDNNKTYLVSIVASDAGGALYNGLYMVSHSATATNEGTVSTIVAMSGTAGTVAFDLPNDTVTWTSADTGQKYVYSTSICIGRAQ